MAVVCALHGTGCESGSREPAPRTLNAAIPGFDAAEAFRMLNRQVAFGPRVPGSASHAECLEFLRQQLAATADSVMLQRFRYSHDRLGEIELTNIIARFSPVKRTRIMLSAHWDSRPRADAEADPRLWDTPVPGANDGASGTAVLLEVARQLKAHPPPVGVDIVLFDGEDMGTSGNTATWCVGSRYFSNHLAPGVLPKFAVNIDMIGDRELQIRREKRSDAFAPEVVDHIFRTAADLHLPQFIQEIGDDVYDDHVPLNEAGIKAIDLIDFSYPNESINYWHTLEDTPDKCSAESLDAVGTLLLHLIFLPLNQ